MTDTTQNNQLEHPQLLNSEMPDVPAHRPTPDPSQPQKIYLKDYTAPAFSVNSIDLTIQLFDDNAKVTANLDMTRASAGDLVLLGRELQLESITLNGKTLTAADYQLDKRQSRCAPILY